MVSLSLILAHKNYLYAAGNSQEGDASESFCSLNKETILTSTSTQGPKPYLFVPQQVCANLRGSSSTCKYPFMARPE